MNAESDLLEIELVNDALAKEAQEVRGAAEFVAGDDLFGDGGAANDVTALEDADGLAGLGKVARL